MPDVVQMISNKICEYLWKGGGIRSIARSSSFMIQSTTTIERVNLHFLIKAVWVVILVAPYCAIP